VMTYVPGGICWNWYSPLPLAVWVDVTLVALSTIDTVEPGITAPEGSVIVPRNEVNDACDQAMLQKPMNKNRNARGWRKQRMRTPSKKRFPGDTRS
jgi:hypothetical protein